MLHNAYSGGGHGRGAYDNTDFKTFWSLAEARTKRPPALQNAHNNETLMFSHIVKLVC